MSNWRNNTAAIVKSLGYKVFIRGGEWGKTYLFYTDGSGKRFGYIQDARGWYHLTTEWVPSKSNGSGGSMGDVPQLTEAILERTLNGEGWGSNRGPAYQSEAQFLKQHAWGGGLLEWTEDLMEDNNDQS